MLMTAIRNIAFFAAVVLIPVIIGACIMRLKEKKIQVLFSGFTMILTVVTGLLTVWVFDGKLRNAAFWAFLACTILEVFVTISIVKAFSAEPLDKYGMLFERKLPFQYFESTAAIADCDMTAALYFLTWLVRKNYASDKLKEKIGTEMINGLMAGTVEPDRVLRERMSGVLAREDIDGAALFFADSYFANPISPDEFSWEAYYEFEKLADENFEYRRRELYSLR